jgi:REP element-mobilizing transposase RayT
MPHWRRSDAVARRPSGPRPFAGCRSSMHATKQAKGESRVRAGTMCLHRGNDVRRLGLTIPATDPRPVTRGFDDEHRSHDGGRISVPNRPLAPLRRGMSHPRVIARIKMKRRQVQGELNFESGKHGGKRPGAGRKRSKHRRDPLHRTRPPHDPRHPSHITLRVLRSVGRLRKRAIHKAVQRAMLAAGLSTTFRVVHTSVQGNHIHLLVEAASAEAISAGMQILEIALARAINKSLKRTGKVFEFRYHRVDVTTPRQARCALAYVLNNWRRHREDVSTPGAENALIDPYSTAWAFDGWRDLEEIPDWDRIPSAVPTTWLLRVGWRRHGTIGVREVPGPLR